MSHARRSPRVLLLCLLAVAVGAVALLPASAGAVVGGRKVSPTAAPWYVATGICGGTLIAPDRIATAAHCFDPIDLADITRVRVGTELRRGVRVALPPAWRERRTGFALDDIAIVQLDRPVTGVRPARLLAAGARVPARLRILGRGQIAPPPPGKVAGSGVFALRQATLRTVGDATCERTWRRSGTKYRNRFEAALMVCATDADERRPLSSVCAGDSGGPMVAGTLRAPVLVGVISWTGPRCGADRLPSVSAEVDRYREFLTAPAPVWAPVPAGPLSVTGEPRVGAALTCAMPAWEVAPEQVEIRWLRRTRGADAYEFTQVGSDGTYVVQPADAGLLLRCEARGSGPGGRTVVPSGPQSAIRIGG